MTNCPNCGAPLRKGRCEYCGTEMGYRPAVSFLDSGMSPVFASSATAFIDFVPSSATRLDTDWLKTGIPWSERRRWEDDEERN